jgi:hypothetical protein
MAANFMTISSVGSIQTDHPVQNIGSMGDTLVIAAALIFRNHAQ